MYKYGSIRNALTDVVRSYPVVPARQWGWTFLLCKHVDVVALLLYLDRCPRRLSHRVNLSIWSRIPCALAAYSGLAPPRVLLL